MRMSTLVTSPAQRDRFSLPVDTLSRMLHDLASRRSVLRGVTGVLAAAISTRKVDAAAAVPASVETCDLRQLTPGEACACLCATDATLPLPLRRQRQCWSACDVWSGDHDLF
jgi:hypothetical protein